MQPTVNGNKLYLTFLRPVSIQLDQNAQIECKIQEYKPGVHTLELSTKCRLLIDSSNPQNIDSGSSPDKYFTKKLDDYIQCDSGLNLDLEARTNFNVQLLKWFKNGNEVAPTSANASYYSFLNDPLNKSYTLRIKNCRPKDTGLYLIDCDGLQCCSEVKIVDTPIKFVSRLQDQFFDLDVDSSITLDCQLNKPPSHFNIKPKWYKNDLEIVTNPGLTHRNNQKYDMIEEHNICALIIYDLDERDEGRYRCEVGNEKCECLLRPEYTLNKYLPNRVDLREHDQCCLNFSLNRAPSQHLYTTKTRWFKNGQVLSPNNT